MINLKKNNGITLVALIITIIIMFILAGVTISTTISNENGVITKAEEAKNKNTIAAEIELLEITWVSIYPKNPNITYEELAEKLGDKWSGSNINKHIENTDSHNKYEMTGDGKFSIKQ